MSARLTSPPDKTRILIVDDHPIVREGVAQFLNIQANYHVCCQAANADEALLAMSNCQHDLAIVDITLQDGSGLQLIQLLRSKYTQLAILTLSMHDESLFAERAVRAGANGYLMKQESTENILLAVRQVLEGNIYLSPAVMNNITLRAVASTTVSHSPIAGISEREFEVLHLIGLGFGTRQIAERLNRSIKTIETHRANLKKKLQQESSQALIRFAIQLHESQ
jgi:DNA-binding NarL/FixJ family response regulator